MEILTLIIRQKWLDEIIKGTKKVETREIRPTTQKRHVILDEEDAIIDIIQYDAIRFYVGYKTDRDSALVEVKDIQLIEIVDDNNKPVYYDYKGQRNQMINIEYLLGDVLETSVK